MGNDDLCEICEVETGDSSQMSVVARRLPSMIATSVKRGDGFWRYWKNVNNITVHTRCYESYMGVENNITDKKRKLQEPVNDIALNQKKQRLPAKVSVKPSTNCIFCGESCEAVESEKITSRTRGIVTEPKNSGLKKDIVKSINTVNDDWAAAVHERIKDKDSLDGVKYHSQCKIKFLFHRRKTEKKIDSTQPDTLKFVEVMKKICNIIDNSGEYQFALEDLKKTTASDVSTDYLREALEKKYGDDIIISSLNSRKTVLTLKRYENEILAKYYETENPKSDMNLQIIQNAANIICNDIQAKLFDSSTYPVIASILDGMGEIIPGSLKTFLDGIILKQKKRVSHKLYTKKIQSIAYSIMASTL